MKLNLTAGLPQWARFGVSGTEEDTPMRASKFMVEQMPCARSKPAWSSARSAASSLAAHCQDW